MHGKPFFLMRRNCCWLRWWENRSQRIAGSSVPLTLPVTVACRQLILIIFRIEIQAPWNLKEH